MFLGLWVGITASPTAAQNASPSTPYYRVESIELVGSSRLTTELVYEQLRINDNTLMSDEWLDNARTKLLGLAVYRNVFFALRKGSKPGYAKLIITAENELSVVSDWAAGGEFGLSLVKPSPDISEESVFKSYRFGLVARNIFNRAHRSALFTEISTDGNLAFGTLAYGLPRFASEAIQFDAAISVVDPDRNYLGTEAFGIKTQALWTRQRAGVDLTYGLAWYSNRHDRYSLDEWPELVSGPKIGILRETRLISFLPESGYRAYIAVIPSLVNRKHATVEGEISRTIKDPYFGAVTGSTKAIQIGKNATSLRAEVKYELPITTSSRGLRSQLYISRRLGLDRFQSFKYSGSETVAGYRYHSAGFIGDINFKLASENPFQTRARLSKGVSLAKDRIEDGDHP